MGLQENASAPDTGLLTELETLLEDTVAMLDVLQNIRILMNQPHDGASAIVTVTAGAGGTDAQAIHTGFQPGVLKSWLAAGLGWYAG